MVKKFNEFINEGMWSRGFDRARNGEERLEEKIKSNLSELKEIDMGIVIFADKDVIVNDKEKFTKDEMKNLIPFFEKNGWKVLTPYVVDNLKIKIKDIFPFNDQYVKIISRETNNSLIFDIGGRIGRKNFQHWWITGDNYYDTMMIEAVDCEYEWAKLYTRKYPGDNSTEFPIRLIKEKKPDKSSNKEVKFNSKTKNDIKEGFNKLHYDYLGTYYWSKKTLDNEVEENIKDFLIKHGDKSKVDLSSVEVKHYPPKKLNLDNKQIKSQYQNFIKSPNENVVLIEDDGKYWYCFWNPKKMYYYYCRLSIQDTKKTYSKYGHGRTIIINNQSVTDAFDEYVYQKTGKTIYKTEE